MPDSLEKYRLARAALQPVAHSAIVYREDGTWLQAKVTALSADDCELLMGMRLEVGERISIEIPGMGRMKAIVRWRAEHKHGTHLVAEVAVDALALSTAALSPNIPRKARWPQVASL